MGSLILRYHSLFAPHDLLALFCVLQRHSLSLTSRWGPSFTHHPAYCYGRVLQRTRCGPCSFAHPLFIAFAPFLVCLSRRDLAVFEFPWSDSASVLPFWSPIVVPCLILGEIDVLGFRFATSRFLSRRPAFAPISVDLGIFCPDVPGVLN